MTCGELAGTGLEFVPTLALLLAAAGLLALGVMLLVRRIIRRGSWLAAVCVLVLVGGLMSDTQVSMAATSECTDPPGPNHTLTISQTSVLVGLGPNITPAAVTGIVTNNSTDGTYVTAIVVSIEAVTTRSGVGVCGVDDYLLRAPRMPVGQTLQGGGSAIFGGASIGFNDTSVNQDACKGATVTLRYYPVG